MNGTRLLAAPMILILATVANAADVGKEVYEQHCAGCHAAGPGHPGTMRLTELRGADKAILTERRDLPAAYIKAIVRNGLLEMPPLRPTEIPDAKLDALANFLATDN